MKLTFAALALTTAFAAAAPITDAEAFAKLKRSTDQQLVFKFDGGENVRNTSMHMGGMKMALTGPNTMVCTCESFKDGKSSGEHSSPMRRVK